jgi:hypothetical protein
MGRSDERGSPDARRLPPARTAALELTRPSTARGKKKKPRRTNKRRQSSQCGDQATQRTTTCTGPSAPAAASR